MRAILRPFLYGAVGAMYASKSSCLEGGALALDIELGLALCHFALALAVGTVRSAPAGQGCGRTSGSPG